MFAEVIEKKGLSDLRTQRGWMLFHLTFHIALLNKKNHWCTNLSNYDCWGKATFPASSIAPQFYIIIILATVLQIYGHQRGKNNLETRDYLTLT